MHISLVIGMTIIVVSRVKFSSFSTNVAILFNT